jgi:hypothetical protein
MNNKYYLYNNSSLVKELVLSLDEARNLRNDLYRSNSKLDLVGFFDY